MIKLFKQIHNKNLKYNFKILNKIYKIIIINIKNYKIFNYNQINNK